MTESVEWERLADHEEGAPEPADSWYDDAPITDEQIEAVRRDLDTPVAQRGAAFAPFVVRKLLAEIDRLNTVLDANRVVRNAAESSSRTYKGAMELLKTQRTQLRSELADARGAIEILRSGGKEQCIRAETAEAERDAARRELAEVREQIGELREEWAIRTAAGAESFCATREGALRIAADWTRIRNDGPWHAESRLVGEWKATDNV